MTMVENVEAALRAQLAKHGSGDIVADMARAAIMAMREPCDAMLAAKWSVRWPAPPAARVPSTSEAVWRAMIEAALADEKAQA